MIILSSYEIITWYIDKSNNASIKEELEKSITNNESEIQIDFDKLKLKNEDTVGYLKVNNTNISYVVVKGEDNSFYLKNNFNKESNRHGWIFMDYHNKLDGTDKNIVIYGHNTRDGSMFGTLRNVITKKWYTNEENYIIDLVLNNERKKYQVFSTYSIPVEDYYITTEFKDNKEFLKFINTLKKRSVHNYKVDIDESDSILTLSTCTGNGSKRMVLHAKELR